MTRDRYVQELISSGSTIALPELRDTAAALYRVKNRGGLGVVAIPEPELDECQLDALARFRFAQYLAAGFVDVEVAYAQRLTRDAPASYRSPDTVHFIVFAAATGELLASMCMVGAPRAAAGKVMGDRERPLFPVEQQFGWSPYNRLAGVPEMPVERVRDFGRLVKNLRNHAAGPRTVIELCVAATRLLAGPLAPSIDLCIGQIEPSRVQRNLEFMHTPLVVSHGGLPCFAPGHPLNGGLEGRERYPFAFAVADLAPTVARGDAVEAALALPDRDALAALVALKRDSAEAPSSLVPPGGLPVLADVPLPQRELSTMERRSLRARRDALARFAPFTAMSASERTTLRVLAAESAVAAGVTLLRRGAVADELILIEAGTVELRGRRSRRSRSAGACLGAEGVVNGAASPVDVVATSDLRILRLARDLYCTYLRDLAEVERELQRLVVPRRRSVIATNTAETQAALRAAGAAERDTRLRNPDGLASRFVSTQPRLQTLAKVRGARRLIPALAERLAPGGYYYETARVKHVDAILAAELDGGLEQLVILGESPRFGIPAGGAADFLAPFGLRLMSDVQPDQLADRYLRRADGTPAGRPYGFSAIAHARVAS